METMEARREEAAERSDLDTTLASTEGRPAGGDRKRDGQANQPRACAARRGGRRHHMRGQDEAEMR